MPLALFYLKFYIVNMNQLTRGKIKLIVQQTLSPSLCRYSPGHSGVWDGGRRQKSVICALGGLGGHSKLLEF